MSLISLRQLLDHTAEYNHGFPAYLNSYAAPTVVLGSLEQALSSGGSLAFLVGSATMCGIFFQIYAVTFYFCHQPRRLLRGLFIWEVCIYCVKFYI